MLNLRAEIQALMKENLHLVNKDREYWYPLAEPTYGADEVMEALDSMISFKTTMWSKTREFENRFGNYVDSPAVMVNSGSSADLLISFALLSESGGPLSKGDEILIPAVTWPTQVWSALMAGFKVKLVDVDVATLNISIDDLRRKISPESKALFLVHLMGNMANMDEITSICREFNLILLEDTCESLGSSFRNQKAGTFGLASSFSFFFSHHITTMEGGMIVSSNAEFLSTVKLLRAHGWSRQLQNAPTFEGLDPRYTFLEWGFNVRPTELQAGFGIHQLKRLESFAQHRNQNAKTLQNIFGSYPELFDTMKVTENVECSWFAFPILIKPNKIGVSRDFVTSLLESNGIETRPVIAGNIARQPALNRFKEVISFESLAGADYIHKHGFYVGISPFDKQLELNKLKRILSDIVALAEGLK
jgi:CDP-6-deoxy-D-xylo-4-hexulose-3-dehydrase